MSHDWDKAYEDGKTLFRLPITCITGRVEGINHNSLIYKSIRPRLHAEVSHTDNTCICLYVDSKDIQLCSIDYYSSLLFHICNMFDTHIYVKSHNYG